MAQQYPKYQGRIKGMESAGWVEKNMTIKPHKGICPLCDFDPERAEPPTVWYIKGVNGDEVRICDECIRRVETIKKVHKWYEVEDGKDGCDKTDTASTADGF